MCGVAASCQRQRSLAVFGQPLRFFGSEGSLIWPVALGRMVVLGLQGSSHETLQEVRRQSINEAGV